MPKYSGPLSEVVKVDSTRQIVARMITVVSADAVPPGLKTADRCRSALTSRDRPMISLMVIITAAKTVSRASPSPSG